MNNSSLLAFLGLLHVCRKPTWPCSNLAKHKFQHRCALTASACIQSQKNTTARFLAYMSCVLQSLTLEWLPFHLDLQDHYPDHVRKLDSEGNTRSWYAAGCTTLIRNLSIDAILQERVDTSSFSSERLGKYFSEWLKSWRSWAVSPNLEVRWLGLMARTCFSPPSCLHD